MLNEMDKKSVKHRNLNQDLNEGLQPGGGLRLMKVGKEEGTSRRRWFSDSHRGTGT